MKVLLVLVVVFSLLVAAASSSSAPRHLLHQLPRPHGVTARQSLRPQTCAPLCWEEYMPEVDLHQYYRLDGCHQFNVTRQSRRNPFFNGSSSQPIEFSPGSGYLYRNSWTDFSLGDDTFAFESWRDRWTWTPTYSEIVHTTIYQSAAQPAAKSEVFDTIVFSSTVYRVHNATFIAQEKTKTTQEIFYSSSAKQNTIHEITFFPRVFDGCHNDQ